MTGQTTSALKAPTGYTGIFSNWNVTVPLATARTGGPWDFGGATDYPVLRGLGALPSFPAGTARLSIAEERAAGTPIGSPLTATDADSNTLTYKLVGADGSHFDIDIMTGQLSTKSFLDYENPVDGDRDNTYELMVQASDGMTVAFRTVVAVRVSDVIENLAPPTITGSAAVTVAENSTAVATYRAQDPDGATSTFTWSLGGTDAGAFRINGGVLTFAPPPNYEDAADTGNDNIYEVTVRADDGGMTGEHAVVVTVDDIDEPPGIVGDARVTLAENSSTLVESYSARDPEGANTSWETLAGADARYFAFDEISGDLSFQDTPDYEARASKVYQVTVRASDAGGKVGELTVTVTIKNVNEAPTISGPETIGVREGHTGTLGTYGKDDPERSLTNWGVLQRPRWRSAAPMPTASGSTRRPGGSPLRPRPTSRTAEGSTRSPWTPTTATWRAVST